MSAVPDADEVIRRSNTVVRFDLNQPIPVVLVTKLVRARAADIDGSRGG
jgi:hypothetical protein